MEETPSPGSSEYWKQKIAQIPPIRPIDDDISNFDIPKLVLPSKPDAPTPPAQLIVPSEFQPVKQPETPVTTVKPITLEPLPTPEKPVSNQPAAPEQQKPQEFPAGQRVTVKRSDGRMETDWIVMNNKDGKVFVYKQEDNGSGLEKAVKLTDLAEWNNAPMPETPPATEPATPTEEPTEVSIERPPLTPEQADKIIDIDKYTKTTREREEARETKRFPRIFGKAQNWFQNSKCGRAVKIGGKMILGTAAMVGAGALAGTPGLALSPMLYSLGSKAVIDGGIEAAQYYLGKNSGSKRRLAIEGAKADLHSYAEAKTAAIDQKFQESEQTESDVAEAANEFNELAKEIRAREEAIMDAQNKDMDKDKKQAAIRSIISSVGAIGVGILGGIPLGIQDFDHNKVSHAVKFTTHGFGFVKKAGEWIMSNSYQHGMDMMQGLGTKFGMPALGKIGVSAALVALLAKTGWDLGELTDRRKISEMPPDFIDLNPVEPEETPDPEAPTPETPAPIEPGKTPVPEVPTPGETAPDGTTPEVKPTPEETTPENPTPEIKPSPEATKIIDILGEKSEDFPEFMKKLRETLANLKQEYANIHQKMEDLDEEWLLVENYDRHSEAIDQRKQRIEDNHAEAIIVANEILAKINTLAEADRFNEIDARLSALDREYDQLDSGEKSYSDKRRISEIEAEHETLVIERTEVRRKLLDIYNEINPSSAAEIPTPETSEPQPENLEEIDFESASKEEQTARLKDITDLYEKGTDEGAPDKGDYSDFLDNAYKYPDRLEIPGMQPWEASAVYNQASHANRVIKEALIYFQAMEKEQANGESSLGAFHDLTEILAIDGDGLINPSTGKMDTKRVKDIFEWSLAAYSKGAEAIGRKPAKFDAKKAETMAKDLEAIVNRINTIN